MPYTPIPNNPITIYVGKSKTGIKPPITMITKLLSIPYVKTYIIDEIIALNPGTNPVNIPLIISPIIIDILTPKHLKYLI